MSQPTKNFTGLDGFVWWLGIVEDRQDPLGLGRVRVRIFGWHTDSLADIPAENLPWASVMHSPNERAFTTPRESDLVMGFFADGRNGQSPVVVGIVPGYFTEKPDTGSGFHDLRSQATLKQSPKKPVSRTYKTDGSGITIKELDLSSNDAVESLRHPQADELDRESISGVTRYQNLANTVIAARKTNLDKGVKTATGLQWDEPYPAYNPLYPYNAANETESGHVFELDDTPTSERIHLAHRSGSFVEYYPSGTKVEKVTKSNYSIVMADDHIHVMGKVMITVDSDAFIRVVGDVNLQAENKLNVAVAGDCTMSIGGAFNVKAASINMEAPTTVVGATKITGDTDIKGSTNIDGGSVNIKGGSTAIGGGSVDINGAVKLQGVISINKGAGSAGGAASGSAAGVPAAPAKGTPNKATVAPEVAPVPLNTTLINFDPHTGQTYRYNQFLDEAPDGTLVDPGNTQEKVDNAIKETAKTNPDALVCGFDPNRAQWISDKTLWDISDSGIAFLHGKEGLAKILGPDRITAYPDPATGAEPYTIGYGITSTVVPRQIKLGDIITKAQAEEDFMYAIENTFLPALKQSVNVPLTQNMINACLSLMYNIGAPNFMGSTLVQKLNASQWCDAADQFLVWNKANKKTVAGLISRRADERSLFLQQ